MKINNLKNRTALSLLPLLLLVGSTAEGAVSQRHLFNFAELKVGVSQPTALRGNTKLSAGDPKLVAGIAAGRKLMKQLALDLEYKYSGKSEYNFGNPIDTYNVASWKANSNAVLLNMSVDLIGVKSPIVPYLKFGAGIANNHSSKYIKITNPGGTLITTITYNGRSKNTLAWQVGIGFNIETTPLFDIQLQYTFANLGKIKTGATATMVYSNGMPTATNSEIPKTGKLQQHVGTIGVRFKF